MTMFSGTVSTLNSRAPAPSSSTTDVTPKGVTLEEIASHKCYLKKYCQKLHIPVPVYRTEVEGDDVCPRFRSTVLFRNETYISVNTFANRMSAEQDVAKLAVRHLLAEDKAAKPIVEDVAKPTDQYLRQLVSLAKGQWKPMMDEFSNKMKIRRSYETVKLQTITPLFFCSLRLNGISYKGKGGATKEEAEQLAAHAAILSLLDHPIFDTPISQFIESKLNVDHAAFREAKDISSTRAGEEIIKTTTLNSGANAMPLNPISGSSSTSLVPITPSLDLADVPSSSRKRQLGKNEKEAKKKLCACPHAKNK